MKGYGQYSFEDFLNDDYFVESVKFPTPESEEFWNQWLKLHPERAGHFRQARLIALSVDFKKTPAENIPKEALLKQILTSIHKEQIQTPVYALTERSRSDSKVSFPYYRVAAAVSILIVATIGVLAYFDKHDPYTTAYGEIRHISLPDGSSVILNANSTLRFNEDWHDKEDREVWLEGEGYFSIVHTRTHQKFFVHTDDLKVEVLGTEFNVNSRDESTKVVLNSGKIRLETMEPTPEEIYLVPGDQVEFATREQILTRDKVNAEEVTSWRNHRLIFKATRLDEIASTLHDYYGWEIQFENEELKTFQFSGTVSTDNVDVLLYTIAESFDIEIIKQNNKLMIRNKKNTPQ